MHRAERREPHLSVVVEHATISSIQHAGLV